MAQHINLLDLDESILKHFATGTEPINTIADSDVSYELEHRKLISANIGFYTTEVIIRTVSEVPQYFRFLEIAYLDNQKTYTKPFEVFKTTEVKTNTYFSSYIEDEDEF